jgi:choline transport protein
MSTLSWQAGTAGASFILGVLIQAVIVAYNPSYVPKRWQGTLFVFLAAAIQGLVNTLFAAQLPRIQKVMVIPHALGWIAVVVVLWVLAPHASAKQVFTTFSSNGGWEPIGLSLMVGQITSVYFLICLSTPQFFCNRMY